MSNFEYRRELSEIKNLVSEPTKPTAFTFDKFKNSLKSYITKSQELENKFYEAFGMTSIAEILGNRTLTKSDFFKYIKDDADNKWEQIFNYLSSAVFINNVVDGTANAVSFRLQAIAQQKLMRDEEIEDDEITVGRNKGKTLRTTYINNTSQHYTVNLIPSTEKFSKKTSVFQAAKGDANKLYEIFYGKNMYPNDIPYPGSQYVFSTLVREYINNQSINNIINTINYTLEEQVNKVNSKNKNSNKISIDKIKINEENKNKFVKNLADALKTELEKQDSIKGFEMTYVSDDFDINISGGSYFQIIFKRNLVLTDSAAPIDKISSNTQEKLLNKQKQSSFNEEAKYIANTLITDILVPGFTDYIDKTNFCPTPNKTDVLKDTINNNDFKKSLALVIEDDFNSKNSNNDLNFGKYVNSLFGKTIIKKSEMKEKDYLDQIQARKSKVQGTLGELLLTALLRMKVEVINKLNSNNKITVSILGQDKNLLDQQSHTDIIVNINGEKIGIQAKQYNSNKFENKQTFYDEEVNVFGGKFIRYIAENSSEKDSIAKDSKIILNYLRYLTIEKTSPVDVSEYLSKYYARFSRIEDIFEDIGQNDQRTFNNFISYNFGMIPMSLILQDILDEIQSLENMFILNPISVDKKDKNKEIKCYILENTDPFTIRYKIEENNQNNNEDDEDSGNNKQGKLMRGLLNFVGISVQVSKHFK